MMTCCDLSRLVLNIGADVVTTLVSVHIGVKFPLVTMSNFILWLIPTTELDWAEIGWSAVRVYIVETNENKSSRNPESD